MDERVSNLKRLLTTGLPICSDFLGILPKRPDMVANENIVLSKSSVEGPPNNSKLKKVRRFGDFYL